MSGRRIAHRNGRSGRPEDGSRRPTVLVTGGGGFVGSAVVRALVRDRTGSAPSDGAPVGRVVAMLRPGGFRGRLAELPPSWCWEIDHADLVDPASLEALVRRVRPACIIHAALDPSAHGELAPATRRERVERPLEVLFRAMEGLPAARLISTGSAAVLAPGSGLDEATPVEPNPAYAAYADHKIREERLAARLAEETGVPWFHLRLFYLFGRYEAPGRLLPYLVRRLSAGKPAELSSGRQIRDYTDVDEAADAYVRAVEADVEHAGIYHVGSGHGLSIRDFARAVADVVGGHPLLRFGAAPAADETQRILVADPGRARRRLGWSASVETEDRIREAAAWWLERRGMADPSSTPT